jgi:hypothetical protein
VNKDAMGNISVYDIGVRLNDPAMKQPRNSQDKCILEMIVKGVSMCNKDLMRFNIPRKHQQASFLSDITATKGDKTDKLLITQQRKTGYCGGENSARYTVQFLSCSTRWINGLI